MTLFAFAGKCVGRGTSELCGSVLPTPPNDFSASSAVNAMAPKPFAQRASISRRVSARGMKFPQWCMSVEVDEFLHVEEHMREVGPCAFVAFWIFRAVECALPD